MVFAQKAYQVSREQNLGKANRSSPGKGDYGLTGRSQQKIKGLRLATARQAASRSVRLAPFDAARCSEGSSCFLVLCPAGKKGEAHFIAKDHQNAN